MIKIDLITGFLGSGKTTFLKKYARYLLDCGCSIGILENDFGAVNVDRMMLQELEGERCELEMVSGGCDPDCHRRRFKTKLIAMGMCGYDRVLVEPSGIYDVDEFFDALQEEPLNRWYEIGSIIAVVDANLEAGLSREAMEILGAEAATAGLVLLSKAEKAGPERAARTLERLNEALKLAGSDRSLKGALLCKDWNSLTREDFERVRSCGYVAADHKKPETDRFSALSFLELSLTAKELARAAGRLFLEPDCGRVYRVKGFAMENGEWLELNAAPGELTVTPVQAGQEVLIVIGEDLNREAIEDCIKKR